jgi:hypothetical protein
LEEIKEEVVAAWRLQKAFDLARAESRRLADEARSAGKPLDEVFAQDQEHEIFRSDPFSWYTLGPVPGGRDVRLRLSEVDGVDGAGPEFMEAVFKLGDGQVAATVNHAHSVAYVIRLAGREQSEQAMREDFLRESQILGQMVRQQNAVQMVSTLLRDLSEVYHVEGWETLDRPRGVPRTAE